MKLTFETDVNLKDYKGRIHKDAYIIRFKYTPETKDKIKSMGFVFDFRDGVKLWFTPYRENAVKLAEFAEGDLKDELMSELKEKEETLEASRAADNTEIDIPCNDGLDYLPFQRAGIAYSIDKESVLFGDEMGLGKTIQAIGTMNYVFGLGLKTLNAADTINNDAYMKKVLVVCPASLKLNWKAELEKWLVRDFTIHVHKSTDEWNHDADIVIINYDILKKFHDEIHSVLWDFLIVDECHYLKNPKAQRTKEIVGEYFSFKKMTPLEIENVLRKYNVEKDNEWGMQLGALIARRKLFLTGTPVPNKVIELWPVIHYLAPDKFYNFMGFAKRYAINGHNGYGYDFTGGRNLEELQEKLRLSVMIRRLKKDVLTELPPKYRQVIEMPLNGNRAAVMREVALMAEIEDRLAPLKAAVELAKVSEDNEAYAAAVKELRRATLVAFEDMSRVRHETALAKVPDVIKYLEDAVENHKVIVFAHHRDVIEKIHEAFGDRAVKLYGGMSEEAKKAAEDSFNDDPNVVLFVGSIKAAGVGLNLQKNCSHVVFAELDWVPGNITQAEDRAHRIGQHDNVLCQHLVLEGSLDAHMAYKLVEKQNIIDKVLDEKIEIKKIKYFVTPGDDGSTKNTKKSSFDKLANKLNIDQIEAIHFGLKRLASVCDGAHAEDYHGFNKVDARVGHSLAASPKLSPRQAALGYIIVLKYHRQLGDELIDRIKNTRLLEDELFKFE